MCARFSFRQVAVADFEHIRIVVGVEVCIVVVEGVFVDDLDDTGPARCANVRRKPQGEDNLMYNSLTINVSC